MTVVRLLGDHTRAKNLGRERPCGGDKTEREIVRNKGRKIKNIRVLYFIVFHHQKKIFY
jgi:hypothetical protein